MTNDLSIHFHTPPVSEVVFSVQFDKPAIDEVGILSEYWPKIRETYGRHEKQPPLLPAVETFDIPIPGPFPFQFFQSFGEAMPQRYWFLNEDGTQLVQVQPDRLLFNWRKVGGNEVYPRYENLLPRYTDLLRSFLSCGEVVEKQAKVAWVEIQYVNPIEIKPHNGVGHGQLGSILNLLVKDPPRKALPPVEDIQLQERFRVNWPDGEPRGRLYLTATPGLTAVPAEGRENLVAYVVTLLARGRPGKQEDPVEAVEDFLNVGHNLIVRGFNQVTRPEMHDLWGKS